MRVDETTYETTNEKKGAALSSSRLQNELPQHSYGQDRNYSCEVLERYSIREHDDWTSRGWRQSPDRVTVGSVCFGAGFASPPASTNQDSTNYAEMRSEHFTLFVEPLLIHTRHSDAR